MPPKRRLLFLAEGATMLHFVRPLALAEALRGDDGYEVHFHAPARFAAYLKNQPFHTGDLDTMPGERFLANLSQGAPLFPSSVLRGYVEADRALIRTIQPDLVIGDMRLSLPLSARLEGARCAAIVNAYWSPYAKRRHIVPEVPLTRLIPPRFLGLAFKLAEPLAYLVHMRPLNRIRREYGIAPLPNDIRRMYTEGDHILYADVPEFVPVTGAPPHHHYAGPCNWELPAAKPGWWQRMIDDPQPKVFVSLGSSGPIRILPNLLAALARLPVSTVLSTSGRVDGAAADRVAYSAPLLPFSETAAAARLVVSHGGSGGLYPALAAGTPVLGIPSNADQHLSTAALHDSGAGLGVRVEEASAARLQAAIDALLNSSQYRDSARQWQAVYARYDSGRLFRSFLDGVFAPF